MGKKIKRYFTAKEWERYWDLRFKLSFNEQDTPLSFYHHYLKNYDDGTAPLNRRPPTTHNMRLMFLKKRDR